MGLWAVRGMKPIYMTDNTINMPKADSVDNAAKLAVKIKETYPKLSDDDIKLYSGQREQFFAKLSEKQNVSKADAVARISELEKACGCGASAAKTQPVKAA